MIKIPKGSNIVIMDEFGRIMISKEIRKRFPARKFEIETGKGEIKLKPVKTLGELFGTLPKINMGEFRKKHEREARDEYSS